MFFHCGIYHDDWCIMLQCRVDKNERISTDALAKSSNNVCGRGRADFLSMVFYVGQ